MKPLNLSQKQQEQIEVFKESLLKENEKINLFSRKNFEKQLKILFGESLHAAFLLESVLKNSAEPVLDLGSGNGFPGIICGILYPETRFFLCDRNRKKAEFLKSTVFKLKANNLEVKCKSAEDIGLKFKKILSQATASSLEVLNILDKILDKKEGEAFLWKSLLWEKDWPKNEAFSAKVFVSYEIGSASRVILKIRAFKG